MSRPPAAPRAADVLLSDGRVAQLRSLVAEDADALLALHLGIGDDNLRLRFFAPGREAPRRYVEHLTSHTGDTSAALVALVGGRLVAVATAERVSPDTAEVAFLVADQEHGHGLGSLLLEHLAAAGRDVGIHRFVADVLADNAPMLRVLRDTGFRIQRHAEGGVVHVEMSTDATAEAIAAADLRDAVSEARSLAPLLRPQTVAVVGARIDGTGLGHEVLTAIVQGGFCGHLWAVHPHVTSLGGAPAVPSLVTVPEPVDLAVLAVPPDGLLEAVQVAGLADVASVVVMSCGLTEASAPVEARRQLVEITREAGLRLVGPDSVGVLAAQPGVRLNASTSWRLPPFGGLAIASQSGGVGMALLAAADQLRLGVCSFVSLGDKADVSGNDLLAAWTDDPDVRVAAFHLESFGNAPKFARLAHRFCERKPLLLVLGPHSAVKTADSETSLRLENPGIETLIRHSGVITCEGAEDLVHTAALLLREPLPTGPRVAVVTNSSGLGNLAVERARLRGLEEAEHSDRVRAVLARLVPHSLHTSNPIDLGVETSPAQVAAVVEALLRSDATDIVLVVLVSTRAAPLSPLLEAVASARAGFQGKTLVLVTPGDVTGNVPEAVTPFRRIDDAVKILGHVVRYAGWLATPPARPSAVDPERAERTRSLALDLLSTAPSPTAFVKPSEARALLQPYLAELSPAQDEAGAAVSEGERGTTPLFALAVLRDADLGPLVRVSAANTPEHAHQHAFLQPPFNRRDASRALRSLDCWTALERDGAVVAQLECLIESLGQLVLDVPEVAELHLDPVVCTGQGVIPMEVALQLHSARMTPDMMPRQLRAGIWSA